MLLREEIQRKAESEAAQFAAIFVLLDEIKAQLVDVPPAVIRELDRTAARRVERDGVEPPEN